MPDPNPLDACPLAERARALLKIVHALAEDWLERAVRKGLESYDQYLFRSADSEPDATRRKQFLTALDGFDRSKKACWPRFRELLQRAAAELPARARGQPYGENARVSGRRLSILSDAEMEASLVLAEFSSYAEMHHSRTLHQLGMRLGVLTRTAAVPIEHNPFGPKALCDCLKAAAEAVNVPEELRVLLLRHLGRQIFDGLGANLKALNEALIAEGVLPNTVVLAPRRARSKGPRVVPGKTTPSAAASDPSSGVGEGTSPATEPSAGVPPAPAGPASSEIFAMLRALLAVQGTGPATATRSATDGSAPKVEDLLATLSARLDAGPAPASAAAPRPAALPPGVAEAAAQADAARLVDLLVGHLLGAAPAQSPGRQLLERLKPAMARLAVRDPAVFTDREHPARQFAERLAGPARSWIDQTGEEALRRRVGAVVEDIASRPYPTAEVFKRATSDLDTQLGELQRLATEGERSHVQAVEEHERLNLAVRSAASAMRELLAGAGKPSRLVRTLLDQAWTDVLVMAMLSSGSDSLGPDSPAGRRLATATQLLAADTSGQRELPRVLRPEVVDGLASIGHDPKDIESLCIRLFEPERSVEDDSIASPTELAMRLKSRNRIVDSTSEPAPMTGELSAVEEQASQTLAKLPVGTWMEFLRPPPDGSLCLKLAWVSPRSGRCLFVDAQGRRALDTTLKHLARGQARGQLRVVDDQAAGRSDDAWDTLIASLSGRRA